MGKRLIHKETGEPTQYIEGQTFYDERYWELVEGELTDEMLLMLIIEEDEDNKEQIDTI